MNSLAVSDYQRLSEIDHVLQRAGMYIGPTDRVLRRTNCYSIADKHIEERDVHQAEGQEQTFLEILGNAADNVQRSRDNGIDPGRIEIAVSDRWVIIKNYGMNIPVEKNGEGIWIPDMIFGQFRTSSNYDDSKKRLYIGMNGLGAKATNIYSLMFAIECADPARGRIYKQIWQQNMKQRGDPEIQLYSGVGYTQVSYSLDFARFGVQEFDVESIEIYAAHCASVSLTCQVPVIFNGITFNIKDIIEYAGLFFSITKQSAVTFCSPNNSYNLCLVDTPDSAVCVSFVNGIITKSHGVHVDAAYKVIVDTMKTFLGKAIEGVTLTKRDVINHVSLFLMCRIPNPTFKSQTKDCLARPKPDITLPEEVLKGIKKWQLVERLYMEIQRKQISKLKKTDGKRRRRVRDDKLEDANFAGSNNSNQATLIVVEGASAKSYPLVWISQIADGRGRDYFGILPLHGKLLNVLNADFIQILENRDLVSMKKALGLEEEMDYSDDRNFKRLRYGNFLFFPDADNDGKHILGLVLLFFLSRFPTLVQRGFFKFMRTPVIRVSKAGQYFVFYTFTSYNVWKDSVPDINTWTHDYFKGLGASPKQNIIDDFKSPMIATFKIDVKAAENISLAFQREAADNRKDWLSKLVDRELLSVETYNDIPISIFVNYELADYSVESIIRSIPEQMDGMKESQRKAFFAALRKLQGTHKKHKIKVAQIASHAAEITCYKHGEASLAEAIKLMTYHFVGSNNMPYFAPEGQFGCVDPNTPILQWDGSIKLAKNITLSDILVGDDGNPRHISKIVNGVDIMYNIKQKYGFPYRVNSQHILTLHFPKHKVIYWKGSSRRWCMEYFDAIEKKVKSKTIGCTNSEMNATEKQMMDFAATIPDNNIFDIDIQTYLSFPKSRQALFRSVRNFHPINWPKRDVPIDPYIFGMWIGGGQGNGRGFASADFELVKEWVVWLDKIGVEVVHNRNKNGHEGYQYGFRRRGATNGINNLIAIGHKDHSSKTCGGCITSNKLHPACDWIYEEKDNTIDRKYDSITINGILRDDMNPFVNLLKKHGLYKNKYIPKMYIINDVETRLQLLAGIIDTDGCLKFQNSESSQFFEVSQEIEKHGHIIDTVEYIAKTLGFKTVISINKGRTSTQKVLSINGDICRIPTKLSRKRAIKTKCKNFIGDKIEIERDNADEYVGWYLDANERFLLGDFTVTHNTRNEGGKDAANARYSSVSLPWWTEKVYRKEDRKLEKRIIDEGNKQECENFFPILPMHVINGVIGIGTAYSTNIPAHNPLDVAFWLQQRLSQDLQSEENHRLPILRPWYKGFTGTITHRPSGFTSEGRMCLQPNGNVIIDELPIGTWTLPYMKFLDSLEDEGVISGYDTRSTDVNVCFIIHKYLDGSPSLNKLKLKSKHSYNNMTVLYRTDILPGVSGGTRGIRPRTYNNITDLLKDYYSLRLDKYIERKSIMLRDIETEIQSMTERARFILAVINEQIIINNRPEAEIYANMTTLNFEYKLLDIVKTREFTQERVAILQAKIGEKRQEKANLELIRPEQLWYQDLEEFIVEYCRREKCSRSTFESCNPSTILEIGANTEE